MEEDEDVPTEKDVKEYTAWGRVNEEHHVQTLRIECLDLAIKSCGDANSEYIVRKAITFEKYVTTGEI